DANGGLHGGAPGLALCRHGGQGFAGGGAGKEGPARQAGLGRWDGGLLVGPPRPLGRVSPRPPPTSDGTGKAKEARGLKKIAFAGAPFASSNIYPAGNCGVRRGG